MASISFVPKAKARLPRLAQRPLVRRIVPFGNFRKHAFDRFRCTFNGDEGFATRQARRGRNVLKSQRKVETVPNENAQSPERLGGR